jgi:hypothetical protein
MCIEYCVIKIFCYIFHTKPHIKQNVLRDLICVMFLWFVCIVKGMWNKNKWQYKTFHILINWMLKMYLNFFFNFLLKF